MLRLSLTLLVALATAASAQTAPSKAPATPEASPTASASAGKPSRRAVYNHVYTGGVPAIALTFDDGPSAKQTPRLLDILAKHKAKATFYLVGTCVVENPDIVKRIVAEGHELGNHSWSHPNLGKMGDAAVAEQIQKTNDAILAAAGVPAKTFRPPYGSFSSRQQQWALEKFDLPSILWSVDPFDWKKPGAAVIAQRILSQTDAGGIILAHDIHGQTVDSMETVIKGLADKGFQFVTVTELIAMEKPRPTPSPTPAASKAEKPAESKPKK